MSERSTALAVSALAGLGYSAALYAAPSLYLQLDETEATEENKSLSRSVASGIAGLASFAYIALDDKHDVQTAACCSLATSFAGYLGNNIYRIITRPTVAAKIDTAVSATLFTLCAGALIAHHKH
jgi:hypothetical protein